MNNKIINCSAFVSQPMNGKTYDEIIDERKRIIKSMREQHDINITYITNDFDYTPECPARTVMLGNSIAKMEESGVIIFTKDAFEAKGCRVEYSVVAEYLEYWRENGGPIVFVECLDGHIIEVEEFNNQLTKKSEKIREQSVEIAALTQANINAKSKIKELEDACDQQAEDNKKLSIELADKKELIDKMYNDLNRLEDIRDTQFNKLCDKDKRIEELKRMVNSVYGLTGGGVICYDCKRKYDNRIKHLESCIKNYKSRLENKNKDIDILLEAVKKIEASKYDDNDVV